MQAIRARDAEAAQVVVRLHIRRTRLAIEGGVTDASSRSRRGVSPARVSRLTV
jgi:DNA-binding GntR family transcriptional regulator